MDLIYLKVFLCRADVKIVVICTVTGGILQVLSKKYLKSYPEFSKDAPVTKKKYRQPRFFSPRGGALIEISGISIKIVAKVVLNFLAKKGLLAGIMIGVGGVIIKIPSTAISAYLRDSFPQNLPHLEKKKFILVGGEKIYLDQCDQSLEYLFKILEDETIPFEEKKKVARSVLTKYLNLQTVNGRIGFVLCIVFLLYILSIQNPSGFYILLENLIQSIKEGRISKAMGRSIVRRLQKKGIPIDPELLEVVSS
jgi:hypothetical protein